MKPSRGHGPFVGGVEAGGTKFRCAVGTPTGRLLKSATIVTRTPNETLRDVAAFFAVHHSRWPVSAIGIASFGPLDLDRASLTYGHILSTPKLDWRGCDIVGRIGKLTGVNAIAFDTDVSAAALAEAKWGAGAPADPLLYVTLGTGIGGGAVVNGRVLRGLLHPEMGHIRIPRQPGDTFEGSCPVHGDCFEGLASGRAMAVRWGVPASRLPREHPGWVLETEYLAVAVVNLVFTLSPKRIVLGGGLTHKIQWRLLRQRVKDLLNGYLAARELGSGIRHYIVSPTLGAASGVLGAIALASSKTLNGDVPGEDKVPRMARSVRRPSTPPLETRHHTTRARPI